MCRGVNSSQRGVPRGFPSCAFYNLHFLGLSEPKAYAAKLANIRQLTKFNQVVAISELHAPPVEAEQHFFKFIPETIRFYEGGMVYVVQRTWAIAQGIADGQYDWTGTGTNFMAIVPGVIHVLQWQRADGRWTRILHFRLDAASDATRIAQLKRATQWMRRTGSAEGDIIIVGGDRNFAPTWQRQIVGSRRLTRHSHELYRAWEEWLASMGVVIHSQPDFTHSRTRTMPDGATHTAFAVLDVVGSNVRATADGAPSASRMDEIPHASASDHWPVGWEWVPRRPVVRGRRVREQRVRRALPIWLANDSAFRDVLRNAVGTFIAHRPDLHGSEALEAITTLMYDTARQYLRTTVVRARSARHQAEVTLRLINHFNTHDSIDVEYAARLVRIYPNLADMFMIGVHVDGDDRMTVDAVDVERLMAHFRHLTSVVAAEAVQYEGNVPEDGVADEQVGDSGAQSDSGGGADHALRQERFDSSIHHFLKELNPVQRHPLHKLWDPNTRTFVTDPEEMATLIIDGGLERQGVATDEPRLGAKFLEHWDADFSEIRLNLYLVEVEEIILGAPAHKGPGPDGVPAEYYKVIAPLIARFFLQAWHELFETDYPGLAHLGARRWVVAAKEEGANTIQRLRDIEAGNTVRKTLARMTIRVLDEIMPKVLVSKVQQAFHSRGNITRSNLLLSTAFADATRDWQADLENVFLLLGLDCTKGYNLLGWKWLQACLERGRAPAQLRTLLGHFLGGEAILMFDGAEVGSLRPRHGLPQGCPLSCLLYVIAVDPLLHYLRQMPGVEVTSGFVDDWTIGCRGPRTLDSVLHTVAQFEQASGQRINRGKSGIVPARRLTEAEATRCRRAWPTLQILYHTKILGIKYGVDVTLDDQYGPALQKFQTQMTRLMSVRHCMSLANRIFAINVYIYSIFQYVNRHFYMPPSVLSVVNRQVLRFLTPVPYVRLNLLAHVKAVYGITAELRDFRLANVASLLATYYGHAENLDTVHEAMTRRAASRPVKIGNDVTDAFMIAYKFFHGVTQRTVEDVLSLAVSTHTRTSSQRPDLQRWLYGALLQGDLPACVRYVRTRWGQHAMDPDAVQSGLTRIPRDTPQGHRWSLLKYHFHGHLTSDRLVRAGVLLQPSACPLCGWTDDDTLEHIFHRCPTVKEAGALLPPTLQRLLTEDYLFFQQEVNAEDLRWVLSFYSAVWSVRQTCSRTDVRPPTSQCARTIYTATLRPWLNAAEATLDRRARRRLRIRAPRPVTNAFLYRSDGACRRERGRIRAGWGVAMWRPGQSDENAPTLQCWGPVSNSLPQTNNVAEFLAVTQAFQRALREQHRFVVFQVDSLLITRFVQGVWGCHSRHLRPLFEFCRHLGLSLTEQHIAWRIEHIYREYNAVSDALADRAIAEGAGASSGW